MNYQNLILEAAHSFVIHAPYVTVDKQLKWADTMLSAAKAIEKMKNDQDAISELKTFEDDLKIMVYNSIDAIVEAYKIWSTSNPKVNQQETMNLAKALDSARKIKDSDVIQAKRNLIAALNKMIEHLNEVDPSEKRHRLPFREELMPSS